MFSSRRYQPVSQHVESESDSDEDTIFTAENGNTAKQKGEWHFGVRAYDLNQDLDLPQVHPTHHPSRRSKDNLRGYTRKQALFGVCVFIVIVTVITTLAVLILLKEGYDTSITNETATEDCDKAPKPLVNFDGGDGDVISSPPSKDCGKGKATTDQQNSSPPTQPSPAPSTTRSEAITSVEILTEAPPSHEGVTELAPSREGVTEEMIPQLPLTTHTEESIPEETTTQFTEPPETESATDLEEDTVTEDEDCTKAPKPLVNIVGSDVDSPPQSTGCGKGKVMTKGGTKATPLHNEAPPTTTPLDPMKSTTPQSAVPTTTTTQSHVTSTTPSLQDEQLLKNWSEQISSEITTPIAQTSTQQPTQHESSEFTQTPPTTISITAHQTTSSSDMTSEPKNEVSQVPNKKRQGIDWEQDFFPAISEATIELFDMNRDGVMDVVTVEDFSQCAVRVVAMNGRNGTKFWQREINFPAFGVRCELDVNSDGAMDCLVIGRGAGFVAIDGRDGSLLWAVDPSVVFPPYNFYFPLIIEDLDNDGVSDIINMHGGDSSYDSDEHNRSPGYLVVISGRTGQSLFSPILTPDGHESYMSPVLFKLNGKDDLVLFGSGGETVPGSLWAVSLTSIHHQIKINDAYKPSINDSHHPCFMKGTDFNKIRPPFDKTIFDFDRPIFVTSSHNSMRFCPSWEGVSPIWNKYGVCLYELYRSESKGIIVPPVIVDLNHDGVDDLVVSAFDGHTVALNGLDAATRLWDAYYPNTESHSVPTPLYYNQDSIPDLLIRSNFGEWNNYNVSTVRVLDGNNGAELWSFDSAHIGMMSSLSIASKSAGSDAMLFMTIGTLDSDSTQSDTDSSKWQRVRRHEHNQINADVGNPDREGVEGEAELMENGNNHQGGVDYDDDFISRAISNHDPPNLWVSTPEDQFPDPTLDPEGFMVYCGESFLRLTTYLWLITREMIEKGEELKPIAMHEPFIFTLPEAPPEDFPADGPPPDNFEVPPEAVGAGPVSKRHEEVDTDITVTKKILRCSHISAPLEVIGTPAVGDFDSDGRLDVAYSVVWSSVSPAGLGAIPEFKVFAFTVEERYRQVVATSRDEEVKGQKIMDFESFLPVDQQPWSRYMGHDGNNTYHRRG